MPEEYREQPDGRLVSGPDLSTEKAQVGFGPRLIIGAFLLAGAVAGFMGGRATAPTPTWQDLYGQRIQAGCLPQVLVVGVGTQAQTDQLSDALDRSSAQIRATVSDAREVETHLKPGLGLKEKNPQAEVVAYVTLERCL